MLSLLLVIAMLSMGALAVDAGAIVSSESRLQAAVDGVARHAAGQLKYGIGAARQAASDAQGDNQVAGRAITSADATVEFGVWDPWQKTFTSLPDSDKAIDSVRYTVRLDADSGRGVPVYFAPLFGVDQVTVQAQAIARVNKQLEEITVPSTANPWLAGSPTGTVANVENPANNADYAGTVGSSGSPVAFDLGSVASRGLAFDAIGGGAGFGSNPDQYSDADGHDTLIWNNRFPSGTMRAQDRKYLDNDGDGQPDAGWDFVHETPPGGNMGRENGKADLIAPPNAIIGIFLGPGDPVVGQEPDALDFSTVASRNFTSLSPEIAQPFFIGDGRNDDGVTQEFIIPAGATRLFLGVMDIYEWNNNIGGYTTMARENGTIGLVK